jgi:hypothetical protein
MTMSGKFQVATCHFARWDVRVLQNESQTIEENNADIAFKVHYFHCVHHITVKDNHIMEHLLKLLSQYGVSIFGFSRTVVHFIILFLKKNCLKERRWAKGWTYL